MKILTLTIIFDFHFLIVHWNLWVRKRLHVESIVHDPFLVATMKDTVDQIPLKVYIR